LEPPDEGGGFYHNVNSNYEVTLQHFALSEAARDLALLGWLTEDPAYIDRAKHILLRYSEKYLTFEIHDKEGRTPPAQLDAPGRATAQGINEAQWIISLAWACDLVRHALLPEQFSALEHRLFRPAADLLLENDEGGHNHQAWYNAGI